MVDALMAWAEANQATIVTPFLLGGATSPVSVAGGLAQQVAEALSRRRDRAAGAARRAVPVRLVLPGDRHADRRAGVRHPRVDLRDLRRRAAGPPLRPAVPRGRRAHAARTSWTPRPARRPRSCSGRRCWPGPTWSCTPPAGSRAASRPRARSSRSTSSCSSSSRSSSGHRLLRGGDGLRPLAEVGPGGLFLAAEHTMLHFKEWLYMSPIFTTQDFTTWNAAGSEDTAQRANTRGSSSSSPTRTRASTPTSTRSWSRSWSGGRPSRRPRRTTERERCGSPASVEEYLSWQDDRQRAALDRLREAIHAAAPEATEGISYAMPAFLRRGQGARLLRRVQGSLQPVPDEHGGDGAARRRARAGSRARARSSSPSTSDCPSGS